MIRACTNSDGESVDVGVGIPDKAFVGLTLTREQALVLAATVRTQVSDPLPEGAVKRDDLLLAYDRLDRAVREAADWAEGFGCIEGSTVAAELRHTLGDPE